MSRKQCNLLHGEPSIHVNGWSNTPYRNSFLRCSSYYLIWPTSPKEGSNQFQQKSKWSGNYPSWIPMQMRNLWTLYNNVYNASNCRPMVHGKTQYSKRIIISITVQCLVPMQQNIFYLPCHQAKPTLLLAAISDELDQIPTPIEL